MSSPLNAILTGSFLSDGTVHAISLPSEYTEIELINITDIGSAAAATPVMKARASSFMADGSAFVSTKTNGAATIAIENTILADGFTFVTDSGLARLGPLVANITGIAAGGLVSTITPPPDGSIVRLSNTVGMLQVAGVDWSVGASVPATSTTITYMPAGIAAPATAGAFQVVAGSPRFYPSTRVITRIVADVDTTRSDIYTSVAHTYTVGEKVRISNPDSNFGMPQINGLLATVVALGVGYFVVDIDCTTFTAFAWPTTAVAAGGISFPQVIPVGEAAQSPYQSLLDDATENTSFSGVIVGTAVQTAAKLYQWIAKKGLAT